MTTSPSPMKAFFGWCLMAVGGLIALTCGLCTFGFMAVFAIDAVRGANGMSGMGGVWALAMPLMFGGLPTALGAGLFVLGWEMTRKREPGVAR